MGRSLVIPAQTCDQLPIDSGTTMTRCRFTPVRPVLRSPRSAGLARPTAGKAATAAQGWRVLLVVAALMLIGAGCSADPADEPADAQPEEQSDVELDTDGVVVVENCSGALEDDDGIPCVGLIAGAPTPAQAGVYGSARGAVAAWAGQNDAVLTELPTDSGAGEYLVNIDLLVERGYEVIVVLGSESDSALESAVEAHPGVYFVGVEIFDPADTANLSVVTFSDHEVGFLAGALAGLLTNSGDVAQILGSALVPPVSDLRDGFANGVAYTNSRADTDAFFHPGDLDIAFNDPGWGAATASQALEAGADVIFGTGGETGHGALVETASLDGEAFCIAVDSDKWDTVAEAQPCLVTSIVKLVDPVLGEILDSIADGDPVSGEVEGDVGYADFHDFVDVVPSEIQQAAEVVAEQVRSGDVSAERSR